MIAILTALALTLPLCGFSRAPRVRLYGAGTVQTDGDYSPSTLPFGGAPEKGAAALPSYYSSAELGYTSGIDNQGMSNVCWAFGHNELLEVNLAKKYGEKYDFSEQAMKFETSYATEPLYGYLREPNDGGNEIMSTAYLARTGSVLEADEPFIAGAETRAVDPEKLTRTGTLTETQYFDNAPNGSKGETYDEDQVAHVKSLVAEYGAVAASIYYYDDTLDYVTPKRDSYCYTGPASYPNHLVTIIGWDDGYSAENFKKKPSRDGAFIVKNSYGKHHANHTSDCFYVSYTDKFVCSCYFVSQYEVKKLYDNVYQYDYMGWVDNLVSDRKSFTGVNRFYAKSNGETLTAVSTYVTQPDTDVEVLICTNGDFKKESAYKSVAKAHFDNVGYYYIPVNASVIPDRQYYIATRVTVSDGDAALPVHMNYSGQIACAAAVPQTCFAGTAFSNLTPAETLLDKDRVSLCIKAFTRSAKETSDRTQFSDVKVGSWYERAVSYAAGVNLFNGTSATKFEPQTRMTRAMFVKVLANLSNADLSEYGGYTGFTDVPRGKWYSAAVLWANENNIVNGMTPDTFEPMKEVSRQQMCVMLLRYARSIGFQFEDGYEGGFRFADDGGIQAYARDAVYICRKYGIINGMTETEFSPRAGATRAQVAAMFMNFCQRYLY